MEKKEKEVKKTTKKTTTTKKAPTKQVAKKELVKKVSEKKETVKKVVKKEVKKEEAKPIVKEEKKNPTKKTTVKKTTVKPTVKKEKSEIKEVKKEEKLEQPVTVVKEEKEEKEQKEQKVVTNTDSKKKISKELFEIRKKRYIIETIIIGVVLILALVLLLNKTFLKTNYKTDAIDVSIPRFSYYVKDKDNIVKFYTLRKSANLKEYYNEYLERFIFYSCAEGNNTFYYNDETKTLIKDIKVEKKFAIKTIEVHYDSRTPEEVCGLR